MEEGLTIFEKVMRAIEGLNEPSKPGLVSDIYFNTDSPVYLNWRREWVPIEEVVGSNDNDLTRPITRAEMADVIKYCNSSNTERQNLIKDLEKKADSVTDFAIDWPTIEEGKSVVPNMWRIRAHIGNSNRGKTLCARILPRRPLPFHSLGFPNAVLEAANKRSGLMLVCGTTGGGKSTTIAALIEHYCKNHKGHVATLENPIEYVLDSDVFKNRLVTQQWVGQHTPSWEEGIMGALRDRVTVIVIGEIRELPELRAAIKAANSGHLVIASTHDNSATRVMSNLVNLFPFSEQQQARKTLSNCLIGVLCQDLFPSTHENKPVIPCYELLVNSSQIRTSLVNEDFSVLHSAMDHDEDCTAWDTCLKGLFGNGLISEDVYKRNKRQE